LKYRTINVRRNAFFKNLEEVTIPMKKRRTSQKSQKMPGHFFRAPLAWLWEK
jgi:hypothetical protein